ncbi:MAG: helix-turn-helix domain-containing protein [Dehalococcoidales bacterium]|nr:helix-turn-helix domain-containing protein [Dehalococcoidales bacterium]
MAEKETERKLTLSVAEASVMLGISRNLGYALARQGQLPGCIKLGEKRMVVSKVALERLLNENDAR